MNDIILQFIHLCIRSLREGGKRETWHWWKCERWRDAKSEIDNGTL